MVERTANVLKGVGVAYFLELRRSGFVFAIIYNAEINWLLEKLFQGGGLVREKFWMGAYADNKLAGAHLRVFERRRLDWLLRRWRRVFLPPIRFSELLLTI